MILVRGHWSEFISLDFGFAMSGFQRLGFGIIFALVYRSRKTLTSIPHLENIISYNWLSGITEDDLIT